MSSSFNGDDLFGSGPHRVQVGRQGYLVLPDDSSGIPTTRNVVYGIFELQIFVRGRLVASSESALWTLRDAVQASLDAFLIGDLVDLHGRIWEDVVFTRVEWGEEVDRGRGVSVPYEARFHRFSV